MLQALFSILCMLRLLRYVIADTVLFLMPYEQATTFLRGRQKICTGFALLLFLGLHIWNFFYRFRYTTMPETVINGVTMDDSFTVVAALFNGSVIYCIIYMLAGLVLALHLSHGFWSAFQTVGWNNLKWIPRLRIISIVFAVLVGVGFAIIPLYFLVR